MFEILWSFPSTEFSERTVSSSPFNQVSDSCWKNAQIIPTGVPIFVAPEKCEVDLRFRVFRSSSISFVCSETRNENTHSGGSLGKHFERSQGPSIFVKTRLHSIAYSRSPGQYKLSRHDVFSDVGTTYKSTSKSFVGIIRMAKKMLW